MSVVWQEKRCRTGRKGRECVWDGEEAKEGKEGRRKGREEWERKEGKITREAVSSAYPLPRLGVSRM